MIPLDNQLLRFRITRCEMERVKSSQFRGLPRGWEVVGKTYLTRFFEMGWLSDKIKTYTQPVSAATSRFLLAKDALKFGIVAGKYIEHNLPTSEYIANKITEHVGKASPRVLDAYDKVSNHWLTKKVVDFANEGGPLTNISVPVAEKAAGYIEKKTGASRIIAKELEKHIGTAPGPVIDAYDAIANSGPDAPRKVPVRKKAVPVRRWR
jgi:hypothetical protein